MFPCQAFLQQSRIKWRIDLGGGHVQGEGPGTDQAQWERLFKSADKS